MTEHEAYVVFCELRWAAFGGKPTCPACGCDQAYVHRSRPLWRCKACRSDFSATSGTVLASRKLSFRSIMAANEKLNAGLNRRRISLDVGCEWRTADMLWRRLEEISEAIELGGSFPEKRSTWARRPAPLTARV